jgi:hypothetical protein
MATTITISQTDVQNAASFLQDFLSQNVTSGDFTPGTALRDLTIGALAAVFAYLQAEYAQTTQLQSLNTVADATGTDTQAQTDAVTALLSNFFIAPLSGTKASGYAIGHASRQVDVFIPTTALFTYSTGIQFLVNSPQTYFIPAASLVAIVDANNVVTDYEFRIPLIATQVGTTYNVSAGQFSNFTPFSPYVTYIEVVDAFTNGAGQETVDQVLARAPTAISVRNLVNQRSIVATLNDNFEGINGITVVGYGDPEMQRDLVPGIAPNLLFHVGGCIDIYLLLGLVETEFTGVVGGPYERPDGVAAIFRDSSNSFSAVEPGDIIQITAGIPNPPGQYMVVANNGTYLVVSEGAPFPIISDEAVPPTTVSYTIGRMAPGFNNVLAGVGGVALTTGITSRTVSTSGQITIAGPVMDILDVAILNPGAGETAFLSPLDGLEHFPNQVNATPQQSATPAAGLQFQTIVTEPNYAQSALQQMQFVVGTDADTARFDGLNLRVRYRTPGIFSAIDQFVRGTSERIVASFPLPRALNPVTVSCNITYTLQTTATALLNNDDIAENVAAFITGFNTNAAPIDASGVSQYVRNAYPSIGVLEPISFTYYLRDPTGNVSTYQSTDIVTISDLTKLVSSPAPDLVGLGVTDRTTTYLSSSEDITVVSQ